MGVVTHLSPPVHVRGPGGTRQPVRAAMAATGTAVVHTTWGEWLPAALTHPALRPLLGRDWPRYRGTADPTVRHRFAVSRLVIKYVAAAALDTVPAELDLAYKIGGRPYVRGLDGFDISLTHSGDLVGVAVSRTGRIGIDTEPAARGVDVELMSGHICAPAELRALRRLPERAREGELLRLWTLKEAYSKALGRGLLLDFGGFGLDTDGTELLAPDGTPAARGAWGFSTHRVLDRYLLSVAHHDAAPDRALSGAVTSAHRPSRSTMAESCWGSAPGPLEETYVRSAPRYRAQQVADDRARRPPWRRNPAGPHP
ncbi:4'-phosphopantetheinyl transferase family protein [Streptomyces sp. NPDC057137]|uniref:4'-phosphopantetheinyl transferase family protein n=1 Tax=Streptomyces sp. NPDC057137 TaxID=3346030 RepID=UPI0036415739